MTPNFAFILQQPAADTLATKDVIEVAFNALATVGAILAALGSVVAFFLTRRWQRQDRALALREAALVRKEQSMEAELARREAEQVRIRERDEAARSKQRDVLYESLRWFEGGTQKRSIGIAVVSSSWDAWPEFRPLWTEMLANQAIYLLTASDQGEKAHEHDNLRRVMDILLRHRALVDPDTLSLLTEALRSKEAGKVRTGLSLTDQLRERLAQWLAGLSS